MTTSEASGRHLFQRFKAVAEKFLDIALDHLGSIPADPHVRRAALRKKCVVEAYPLTSAGQAFNRIAWELRSEGRRVGKAGYRPCRSWWSPCPQTTKKPIN